MTHGEYILCSKPKCGIIVTRKGQLCQKCVLLKSTLFTASQSQPHQEPLRNPYPNLGPTRQRINLSVCSNNSCRRVIPSSPVAKLCRTCSTNKISSESHAQSSPVVPRDPTAPLNAPTSPVIEKLADEEDTLQYPPSPIEQDNTQTAFQSNSTIWASSSQYPHPFPPVSYPHVIQQATQTPPPPVIIVQCSSPNCDNFLPPESRSTRCVDCLKAGWISLKASSRGNSNTNGGSNHTREKLSVAKPTKSVTWADQISVIPPSSTIAACTSTTSETKSGSQEPVLPSDSAPVSLGTIPSTDDPPVLTRLPSARQTTPGNRSPDLHSSRDSSKATTATTRSFPHFHGSSSVILSHSHASTSSSMLAKLSSTPPPYRTGLKIRIPPLHRIPATKNTITPSFSSTPLSDAEPSSQGTNAGPTPKLCWKVTCSRRLPSDYSWNLCPRCRCPSKSKLEKRSYFNAHAGSIPHEAEVKIGPPRHKKKVNKHSNASSSDVASRGSSLDYGSPGQESPASGSPQQMKETSPSNKGKRDGDLGHFPDTPSKCHHTGTIAQKEDNSERQLQGKHEQNPLSSSHSSPLKSALKTSSQFSLSRRITLWENRSIPPYPEYQSFQHLMDSFRHQIRSFYEAQSYWYLFRRPDTQRDYLVQHCMHTRFSFESEYSTVALDYNLSSRLVDLTNQVTKGKHAIEVAGGFHFTDSRWVDYRPDGGFTTRFACFLHIPLVIPSSPQSQAKPQSPHPLQKRTIHRNQNMKDAAETPTLVPYTRMRGELEIAVLPDASHPVFPGQRTIVRFCLVTMNQ